MGGPGKSNWNPEPTEKLIPIGGKPPPKEPKKDPFAPPPSSPSPENSIFDDPFAPSPPTPKSKKEPPKITKENIKIAECDNCHYEAENIGCEGLTCNNCQKGKYQGKTAEREKRDGKFFKSEADKEKQRKAREQRPPYEQRQKLDKFLAKEYKKWQKGGGTNHNEWLKKLRELRTQFFNKK